MSLTKEHEDHGDIHAHGRQDFLRLPGHYPLHLSVLTFRVLRVFPARLRQGIDRVPDLQQVQAPELRHCYVTTSSSLRHYYITATSLLPHRYVTTTSLLPYRYVTNTSLLPHRHVSNTSLLPHRYVTTKSLKRHTYVIATSQLHHCYVTTCRAKQAETFVFVVCNCFNLGVL